MTRKNRKKQRSCCPVACTLDLIGDKWTMLVIRDLFLGRTQFKEFASSPERIATNILSNRLARLVDEGLAEKFRSLEQPNRDAYRLTKKGKSLEPVLLAIVDWGSKNIDGAKALMRPK